MTQKQTAKKTTGAESAKVVKIDDPSKVQIVDGTERPKTYVRDGIEYTADGKVKRAVYVERPDLDEPGLTKVFDGEYNINDLLGELSRLDNPFKVEVVDDDAKTFKADDFKILNDYLTNTKITNGEFPAEAERFNRLLSAALKSLNTTYKAVESEINKLNDVFSYFYLYAHKDDAFSTGVIAGRLNMALELAEYENKLRSLFSNAILNDAELLDLMTKAAPYYRVYMLADLLRIAIENPDQRVSIFQNFRATDGDIAIIETDAAQLAAVVDNPSVLHDPSKCPNLFIENALIWNHSRPDHPDTDDYYRQMVADVITSQKEVYRDILSKVDQLGPDALDDNAAKLGLIDLMSVARDFETVKGHQRKLRPVNNAARLIYTRHPPAKQTDFIASNSYIYRHLSAMSLDEWNGIDPIDGTKNPAFKNGDALIIHRPTGRTLNANERLFIKYTPRPWDRFVIAVYDALASLYFDSDQWKNRDTNEFVNVQVSFYTLKQMVAPSYFRIVSKQETTHKTKVYENKTEGANVDDGGIMDAILDAVNVLMSSVIKIKHNDAFKQTYNDVENDGFYSDLEQELNAVYAIYSKSVSKSGEFAQGLTIMAPPILPYECLKMGQTVDVPREDYLTNKEYAKYLKEQYGIDSQPLKDFKDYNPDKNSKFITFTNSDINIRVKFAVVNAFNVLKADIEKNNGNPKHAIEARLDRFTWLNDLYPAVFGTLNGEWSKGENGETVVKEASPVNYDSISDKSKLKARRAAIAQANNLMIRYGVKYEIMNTNARNTTGDGIRFKPVSLDNGTKKPAAKQTTLFSHVH